MPQWGVVHTLSTCFLIRDNIPCLVIHNHQSDADTLPSSDALTKSI